RAARDSDEMPRMPDDSLDSLEELFERAADLPPALRPAFLDRERGDNAALRAAVAPLLRSGHALGDGDDFLRSPLRAARAGAAPPAGLGRSRVLRLPGAGGRGAVWEPRQESRRRTVARRVIHPGLATPGLVNLFARGPEVLARLHHPGIGQVFEAGVAD